MVERQIEALRVEGSSPSLSTYRKVAQLVQSTCLIRRLS